MVNLFLSETDWKRDGDEDDDSVKQRICLLNELESRIRLLVAGQSRSEARLWLCKDVSGISSLSRKQKCELFLSLMRSSSQKRDIAAQVLQMVFEKQPKKAGCVLAKRSDMLEDFFRGNTRRILLWFSKFSGTSDMEHRKGAKALSQFAFMNRDICWEELEWKGKHGQSPAMVATKPHYFLDLDVEQTVENFLENVPEFWSSHEFADTLKDGNILFLDMKFFINMFLRLMYKEDMEEIWEIVKEFLMEESFSSLCSHLLIALNESELCVFLDLLKSFLESNTNRKDSGDTCTYLEVILPRFNDVDSIDELLLLNTVINRGRQLLQLLQEDEHREEKTQVKDIVQKICTLPENPNCLLPLIKGFSKKKSINAIKLLGLQSWALHYFMSEGYQASEDWESLFNSNGIGFRHAGKHELLHDKRSTTDDSDSDSRRKKKGKHRKKRRRNSRRDDSYDNDFVDFDFEYNRMDFQFKGSSWLLSTDGYSTSWSSADLPEHLSKHCFSTWLKWCFHRCGDSD